MTTQLGSETIGLLSLDRLKEAAGAVIDLLFPPHCVGCNHLGAWLCSTCQEQIETIQPPVCPQCGLPVASPDPRRPILAPESGPACTRCQQMPSELDKRLAFAFHTPPIRQAIHQLKYQDLRSLAAPLGQLMAEGWRTLVSPDQDIDVIVPVPLHAARHRQRGYNQAALLARELGAHLNRPVVEDVLERTKATRPQVGLDAGQRRINVQDAFRCRHRSLSGQRVLLIDDVCTTGSTLEAASSALLKTGVSSVWAYTLAHAKVTPNEQWPNTNGPITD